MTTEKLQIDIGCGKNKKPGFIGVDIRQFEGVNIVLDAGKDKWPWEDNSVDEAHSSHHVEHLKPDERIHFVNELHRVLKPGAKAQIIVPHWCSNRAYGDLTHQWPPVAEMWFYYLDKGWREVNAPHNDFYTCDFLAAWGYTYDPQLNLYNSERAQFHMQNYKEAILDIVATLEKKQVAPTS